MNKYESKTSVDVPRHAVLDRLGDVFVGGPRWEQPKISTLVISAATFLRWNSLLARLAGSWALGHRETLTRQIVVVEILLARI